MSNTKKGQNVPIKDNVINQYDRVRQNGGGKTTKEYCGVNQGTRKELGQNDLTETEVITCRGARRNEAGNPRKCRRWMNDCALGQNRWLTRQEVADLVGISRMQLWRWEQRKKSDLM